MSHDHEKCHKSCALHLGLKIAKLAVHAAAVAALFCVSHEVHKVHHAIKKHH